MSIEFIYFDLGKVLLDFDHWQGCQQMADLAGISAEQVWQVLFESGLQNQYEAGEISRQQFYDLFCEQTGTQVDDHAIERAGCDIFSVKSEVLPIIVSLAVNGYRLGLLSNTSTSHWKHCRKQFSIFENLFETIVLSFEVRAMKPSATIYKAAVDRAGVPAGSILFIDDLMENVTGARQAGLEAVQFTGALPLATELRSREVRLGV